MSNVTQLKQRFRPIHLPTETPTHRQFTDGQARAQLRRVILILSALLAGLVWVIW